LTKVETFEERWPSGITSARVVVSVFLAKSLNFRYFFANLENN
jgi:hypothetical protein